MNAPSIYRDALLKAPNLPVKDENGNYVYDKGTNPYGSMDINPVADAVLNTNRLESTEGIGNIFLQYKPVASLTLRSEFGAELNNNEAYTRRVKRPSGYGNDAVQSNGGNKKLVVKSPFINKIKLRCMPQPGQSICVRALNIQGSWWVSSHVMIFSR